MDYKSKYYKYKNKYLNLKNQIAGSSNRIDQQEQINVNLISEDINVNMLVNITADILESIINYMENIQKEPLYIQVFFGEDKIEKGSTFEDYGIEDDARLSIIIQNSNEYLTKKYGQSLDQERWYEAIRKNRVEDYRYFNNIKGIDTTTIGKFAFYENQLEEVNIPDSVETIGSLAFAKNQLEEVNIPDFVETIGRGAFSNNQLTTVKIPNSVETIDSIAFGNNQLEKVNIGNSVKTIGNYAFAKNRLITVEIPNSVKTIDGSAFSDNRLEEVTIPNSVTEIGWAAFANNQLEQVTIPTDTIIADNTFDRGVEIIRN